MPFKKLNLIVGWAVFAIALLTYLLTIEPTASLWDCAEFIATSYKLEVGHPPGTPFFFLINRLGAMFASDPTAVGGVINGLSALESAFTILFLFWSIAHLGRRIYNKKENELTTDESWAVIGAATIGALAYTFSDTFWFSAVEAEVYALSSLFTAVVFWAILKWENVADEKGGNRWLVLIAYLMGLSIGAHILNLLAIPALVLIYYFKKFPNRPSKDLWKPTVLSLVILGGFYMLTPTTVSIAAFVDRIFVNSLGMPVNSGVTFFIVALLAALGYGVWRTQKAQKAILNTIFISAAMVVIGFSTYGVVLIRSSANPPMNSNHPKDPYTLERFINREQYGSRPLITGQTFNSTPIDVNFSDTYVLDDNGKYQPLATLKDYKYDPATTVLFPRMHYDQSLNRDRMVTEYKNWSNFTGKQVRNSRGELVTIPTFGDNMAFFFNYQINNMYWRYLLWNFVGRQSDLQYDGITNGNWLSGIDFIDELYLGPQDNLPSEIADNKGRNTYFFLPFILAMFGLFFHLKRDGRNFAVVMMLFIMTGLAIIVYLNQTPLQPRERDYAYAASFYAFAMWIGIGVLPIYEFIRRKVAAKTAAIGAIVLSASVPTVLAVQNWDDHDRSGRTIARDMGYNYLASTLPQSILINHGDSDTFPVWYMQEVEGFRTDVRPLNSSYISGDWYIDQMRIKSNESEPVPISVPRSKYYGKESTPVFPVIETQRPGGGVWTAKEVMEIVNSDNPSTKREGYDFIPAKRIAVPVNRENVIKSGVVKAEDAHLIEDTIYINLRKDQLYISDLILLDIIAQNDWKRPIYTTSPASWLDFGLVTYNKDEQYSYMKQEGSVSLLVPFKTPVSPDFEIGYIDTEELYDNLMNKTQLGNLSNPKVYLDSFVENTLRAVKYRETYARLAKNLLQDGDTTRAVVVLDKIMELLPPSQLRYDDETVGIIEAYWLAGEDKKGDALATDYARVMTEYVNYYDRFTGNKAAAVESQSNDKLISLYRLAEVAQKHGKTALTDVLKSYFE